MYVVIYIVIPSDSSYILAIVILR